MGLNYLQKKNWHPGSLKNQEIVWIREQLQAEIIKRENERAKKLAEEKNIEELKRIQAEAGLIPKSHLDRMEWMYDVGKLEQQQNTAEEYLTGKPISQQEADQLVAQRDKAKNLQQQQQYQTVFKEETTNLKCEDFVKVHEDPLYKIMKGELSQKNQILQNVLKMKQLLDSQKQIKIEKTIKKEKSSKLEKKEEKKNKKHKKHHSETSSDEESSQKQKKVKSSKKEKKSKKSKKNKKNHSKSSSDQESTTKSNGSAQSQIYKKYIQERLGNIAVVDDKGNVKADFGLMKKKFRNNLPKESEVEALRKQMVADGNQRMNQNLHSLKEGEQPQKRNGQFLQEMRKEIYSQDSKDAFHDRLSRNKNYQEKLLE